MSKNSVTVPRCSKVEYTYMDFVADSVGKDVSAADYREILDAFYCTVFSNLGFGCSYDCYVFDCEHADIVPEDIDSALHSLKEALVEAEFGAEEETEMIMEDPELYGIQAGDVLPNGTVIIATMYDRKPEPAEASPEVPEDDAPEEFIEPECVPDLPFSYSDLPFPEVLFQQRELLTYLDYLDNNLLCVNYICCIIEFNYHKRFVSSYAAYCEFALNNGFRVESHMDAFKSLLEFSILYQESIIEGGYFNAG